MSKTSKIYHSYVNNDNNNKVFYSKNNKSINEKENIIIDNHTNLEIEEKIKNIFKNNVLNYTKEVNVILKNGDIKNTRFIKKMDKYILTIDNEKILISDIKDIK